MSGDNWIKFDPIRSDQPGTSSEHNIYHIGHMNNLHDFFRTEGKIENRPYTHIDKSSERRWTNRGNAYLDETIGTSFASLVCVPRVRRIRDWELGSGETDGLGEIGGQGGSFYRGQRGRGVPCVRGAVPCPPGGFPFRHGPRQTLRK